MKKESYYDKLLRKLKDNKVVAYFLIAITIFIGGSKLINAYKNYDQLYTHDKLKNEQLKDSSIVDLINKNLEHNNDKEKDERENSHQYFIYLVFNSTSINSEIFIDNVEAKILSGHQTQIKKIGLREINHEYNLKIVNGYEQCLMKFTLIKNKQRIISCL